MAKCEKTSRVCTVTKYARLAFVVAVGVHILLTGSALNDLNAKLEADEKLADSRHAYLVWGVNRVTDQIFAWAQTVEERLAALSKPENKPTQETK